MQLTSLRLAALTLAGSAFLASAAVAAQPYADGDVILAIRATANPSSSYLYNLGPASAFLQSTSQLSLNLNIATDLVNAFGPEWSTRSDLFWSVSGVSKDATETTPANIMYVSTKRTGSTLGAAGSNAYQKFSITNAGQPAGRLRDMSLRYALGSDGTTSVESAINAYGLLQPNGEINSYRSYTPGGTNSPGAVFYGVFSANGGAENSFASGPTLAGLDFYAMTPGASAALGITNYEGHFNIDGNANVSFTPEGVPEPASATVLAAGALVLGCIRRRSRAVAR